MEYQLDDDIEFNLQKIIYKSGSDIITMFPIDYYFVENIYPVFIYKLEYNDISANITFYMSNGKTNGYRGNLLLPFLCIKSDDKYDSCPISDIKQNMYGLVYKLIGCDNINIHIINEKLKVNAINIINEKQKKNEVNILYDEIERLTTFSRVQGSGVITVLQRITDFAILLLNLANKKIISLNKKFIDTDNINDIINNIDTIDERLFVPYSNIDKSIIQFNQDSIQNFIQKPVNEIELNQIQNINKLPLIFRKLLVHKLHNLSKYIIDNKKFTIEYVNIKFSQLKKVSYNEFNNVLQICVNNQLRQEYKDNYIKFNEISTIFANLYKTDTKDDDINELRDIIKDGLCKKIEDNLKIYEIKCDNKLNNILFLTNLEKEHYNKIYNKYITFLFNPKMLNFLEEKNEIFQLKPEFVDKFTIKFRLSQIGIDNYERINTLIERIKLLLISYSYKDQEEINTTAVKNLDRELYKIINKNIIVNLIDDNIVLQYLTFLNESFYKLSKLCIQLYDISAKYEHKYLKYKYKYLELKNEKKIIL